MAAVTLLILAFAGFGAQSGAMWSRPLWLDEWHTILVSRQQSFHNVVESLARGADFNPPLLFSWHWTLGNLLGDVTMPQLRLTAMVSVWLALLLVFTLLRRAFEFLPSVAATLVLATNGEIVRHAFEARFYGPWLCLTVLHAWLLTRAAALPRSVSRQSLAFISAVLLCLIHYFGIITLAVVTLGIGLARRPARGWLLSLLPSTGAGLLTVLTLVPLVQAQRAALSAPTWVPPPHPLRVLLFLLPSLLMLVAARAALLPFLRAAHQQNEFSRDQRATVFALLSLVILPGVLVLFSLSVQSVLLARYALPSLLALGPIVAAVFSRLQSAWQVAGILLLIGVGVLTGTERARSAAQFSRRVRADSVSVEAALASGAQVVVPSRLVLYPLLGLLRERTHRIVMPAIPTDLVRARFPEDSDSASYGDFEVIEQDVAKAHARIFGRPRLVEITSLTRHQCVFILESSDEPVFASRWMPTVSVKRVQSNLFLLRPRESPPDSGTSSECPP